VSERERERKRQNSVTVIDLLLSFGWFKIVQLVAVCWFGCLAETRKPAM
jgi:hypothetical protein